jgi:histone deacetylase 6
MEDDEDIVMGESGSQTVVPVGSTAASIHSPRPAALEKSMHAPSFLGQQLQEAPLMRASSPSTHESTPVLEHQVPPVKVLTRSIEEDGLNIKFSEDSDSLREESSDWSAEDATMSTGLPLTSLATGLCYDIRMRYHCEVRPTADVHPEDPRRIYYIYKEICRAGLVDDPESTRPLAPRPLQRIDVRNATEDEIQLVHAPEHYTFVESTKGKPSVGL